MSHMETKFDLLQKSYTSFFFIFWVNIFVCEYKFGNGNYTTELLQNCSEITVHS